MINEDGQHTCSGCGEAGTHQACTLICNRKREDSEDGLFLIVHNDGTIETVSNKYNSSDRRNSTALVFYCETCMALTCISYDQHKGNTFVSKSKLPTYCGLHSRIVSHLPDEWREEFSK
jgi:hypothetical protein